MRPCLLKIEGRDHQSSKCLHSVITNIQRRDHCRARCRRRFKRRCNNRKNGTEEMEDQQKYRHCAPSPERARIRYHGISFFRLPDQMIRSCEKDI